MATIKTDLICNLNQPVNVTYLHGNLFSQDNAGNTINVFVMDNGEPATIGGTVSANVIRSDGQTVAVSGAIEGNKAYVILPQACYAVPGVVHIIIKLTQNTTITTIAAIVANVYMSTTDAVIDPGTVIPSIQALMALIEEAVDSIPTDYTGLLHTIAADYSSSKTYKVGDYAWESGVLKRCIVPITAAETYTAAHWTNAVIGDDLTNLKSAFTTSTGNEFYRDFITGYFRLNVTTVNPNDIGTAPGYSHLSVDCSGGDVFTISGNSSGAAARLYAFVDSSYNVLDVAAQGATANGLVIIAPANSAKLLVNNYVNSVILYTNKSLPEVTAEQKTTNEDLYSKVAEDKARIYDSFANVSMLNKNRYNGVYVEDFRLDESGNLVPTQASWNTTDFIFVGDLAKVNFSSEVIETGLRISLTPYYLCTFDKELNFIAYIGTSPDAIFEIPNGVYYIRFCFHPNLVTDVQVESGSAVTYYAPFDFYALAKATSNLNGKKVTVIGDSITERNSTAAKNWTVYLSERTGCTIQNLGLSGTGFYNSNPYKNRIDQIAEDTDIIGIAISFNDIGKGVDIGTYQDKTETTLCGYAYVCLTQIQALFPTVPIIVYSQGPWSAYHYGGSLGSGGEYIEQVKKLANRIGIPVYDELYFNGSALRPWDSDNQKKYYKNETTGVLDGTHPNSEGHKIIANYLIPKFMQNVCSE